MNNEATKFQIGDRITNDAWMGTGTVIKISRGAYVVRVEDTNSTGRIKFQYESKYRKLAPQNV